MGNALRQRRLEQAPHVSVLARNARNLAWHAGTMGFLLGSDCMGHNAARAYTTQRADRTMRHVLTGSLLKALG